MEYRFNYPPSRRACLFREANYNLNILSWPSSIRRPSQFAALSTSWSVAFNGTGVSERNREGWRDSQLEILDQSNVSFLSQSLYDDRSLRWIDERLLSDRSSNAYMNISSCGSRLDSTALKAIEISIRREANIWAENKIKRSCTQAARYRKSARIERATKQNAILRGICKGGEVAWLTFGIIVSTFTRYHGVLYVSPCGTAADFLIMSGIVVRCALNKFGVFRKYNSAHYKCQSALKWQLFVKLGMRWNYCGERRAEWKLLARKSRETARGLFDIETKYFPTGNVGLTSTRLSISIIEISL